MQGIARFLTFSIRLAMYGVESFDITDFKGGWECFGQFNWLYGWRISEFGDRSPCPTEPQFR
jgi:hypothetical protein